ncbi:MAG: hypothetical protein K8F91_20695, partial [Candidatus Obscuribacterales bacterium]|nr:hypothetical protein [Candidatus Obscuribacterales bacterium]
ILLLILLLIAVVAAAFSFDYGHGLVVREELQNATDAAALAGAYELATFDLTADKTAKAEKYAFDTAGKNTADNVSVANDANTILNVVVNGNSNPRTVTVTATRTTGNIFARLIGWNTMPVSSTSTASAFAGLKQVKPGQLLPLTVSLDHKPTKGPQKGVSLNDYINGNRTQKFTIVLNPQGENNGAWIKNWNGKQNPIITFGVDQAQLTNGVKADLVKDLSPGDQINVPIITGGPPFNKERTIIGVSGFEVTRINFPQEIEGVLVDPLILKGTPGQPVLSGITGQDQTFLQQNEEWAVLLTN